MKHFFFLAFLLLLTSCFGYKPIFSSSNINYNIKDVKNITQDQDEKGPKVDEEEPLVQEPELVDGGENPGVPQELKNSANKTEESEDQDKQKRKSGIAAGIKSAGIPKKFGGQ